MNVKNIEAKKDAIQALKDFYISMYKQEKILLSKMYNDPIYINNAISEKELSEKLDTILNKEALRVAGIDYAGNDGINSYLVNPIDGNLSILQNIKIFIGKDDILNPDCHLLKEKAEDVNADVEIKEYEQAKHIWLIDNNSEEEITKKAYNDLIEELLGL